MRKSVENSVLWQSVLGEIEVSLSPANFNTWFKRTRLLKNSGNVVTIGVPNIFAKQQLEKKFNDLVQETLRKNGVGAKGIEYRIYDNPTPLAVGNKRTKATPPPTAKPLFSSQQTNLNPRYNFENFVVGSGNELAYAAAQAVAGKAGQKYNPLFIYGGAGLGKTHLIQAIGNAIVSSRPQTRLEYITSEQFLKEFVASILYKKPFSNRYRSSDVLIIDDMQFIAGKEKVQEEFFHTFNALHERNKQIIISSDRAPKAMATLEDRLRSRFEWGMTADIQPPDYETRVAILQSKINDGRKTVPADVVEYLATNVQSNVRELEGTLNRLFGLCEMRGLVPSLDLVQQMLSPKVVHAKHITAKNIIVKTAKYFDITVDELTSPRRDKRIAEARQIAMYLMRSELSLSYPNIAKMAGRSDHTTAIHSVNKIEKSILNSHYLRQKVFDLKEKLYV